MKSTCRMFLAAVFLAAVAASGAHAATNYKILHNFNGQNGDGYAPEAGLVFDSSGNLYGTTVAGGIGCYYPGCGIVFQLKPNSDGTWSESIIHSFSRGEGATSYAPLTLDSRGNLFGTTSSAGSGGYGSVFELMAGVNGAWAPLVLQSFTGGPDGGQPVAGVLLGTAGHVYGTTAVGGGDNSGVVFGFGARPKPGSTVLHSFGIGGDGTQADGTLVSDASGNLYGTTWSGGSYGAGTVFKITPNALSGSWSETVLYSFQGVPYGGGSDGANPYAGVVLDAAGNLYGTTFFGGEASGGTVFKLSPNADGSWSETLLHIFTGQSDGGSPYGGVTFDRTGNLYGTTNVGGAGGHGTVFKMTRMPTGQWIETVLHGFTGRADGGWPGAGVILDSAGNIFGTAAIGGSGGFENGGVVFEITPLISPACEIGASAEAKCLRR